MALKSSYNGEENKMRMSRIAKPRSNSGTPKMSASASSAVLRQQKGPLANAAKQKTATPRSAVLRQAKSAPSSGSAMKKSATARKKVY